MINLAISARRVRCLALAILSVSPWLAGCGGPVPAPTGYATYRNEKGGFSCDYPEGWEADGGGNKANFWAKFTKQSAQVKLQTDIKGSVLGDIGSAGGGTKLGAPEDEDMPVHKLHLMKDTVPEEFADYKEQEPVKFNNALGGDGRKSEFTAAGGLSGPIHGYRATFLNRDRRFTVICSCNESDWATLKPAFDRILTSFRAGA